MKLINWSGKYSWLYFRAWPPLAFAWRIGRVNVDSFGGVNVGPWMIMWYRWGFGLEHRGAAAPCTAAECQAVGYWNVRWEDIVCNSHASANPPVAA